MNEILVKTLRKLFAKNRIVFWRDPKGAMAFEYASLVLPGVEKIAVNNNEFGVKYRVLREEPEQKFLIYLPGPEPDDRDNWLLDLELAYPAFRGDLAGPLFAEIGLDPVNAFLAEEYPAFFVDAELCGRLRATLKRDDAPNIIREKMLAACAGSPDSKNAIEDILAEAFEEKPAKFLRLRAAGLEEYFWNLIAEKFGYVPAGEPTLKDFLRALFMADIWPDSPLKPEASRFRDDWKNNINKREQFREVALAAARDLGGALNERLRQIPWRELLPYDHFAEIEPLILRGALAELEKGSLSATGMASSERDRRLSLWRDHYAAEYEAMVAAAALLERTRDFKPVINDAGEACRAYASSWYKIDQFYRRFVARSRAARGGALAKLAAKVESVYLNKFLEPLANAFYDVLPPSWPPVGPGRQEDFFAAQVRPFLERGGKVCVIISDALRYEIGAELAEKIAGDNRFAAEIEAVVTPLPSVTAIGMAALLPHKELTLVSATKVPVDGEDSSGLEHREKILRKAARAKVLTADELAAMSNDALRETVKNHDLLYVYQGDIDARGEALASEKDVFAAADKVIGDLSRLVKKLTSNNVNNILVTADHGFLFQMSLPDKMAAPEDADKTAKRYLLGRDLAPSFGLRLYKAGDYGLKGELDVLVACGLNRVATRGGGYRYAHGGASLWEILVPVIKINKKRKDDVSHAEVTPLGENAVITSAALDVVFYQTEPVGAKIKPVALRAGFYGEDGAPLSNSVELIFDSASQNPRERERKARFNFTSAAAGRKEAILRMEIKKAGYNDYAAYKTGTYELRNAFAAEIDEWDI